MKYFKFLIPLLFIACNNEKVILLPEVEQSNIHEVLDVSPAYLFYDSTAVNNIELNRKNLIITTNWLVNVDKRLTLKQLIPKIQFLQNKKRSSELHKNEDAKNYYSCNDTSIKNLGFVEFTDVYYHTKDSVVSSKKAWNSLEENSLKLQVESLKSIGLPDGENTINLQQLVSDLKNSSISETTYMVLNMSESLTFQEYISLKSALLSVVSEKLILDTNEFIY
ncbi:hypothetical protein BZARG_2618 [Bizionia argentinensis JUB59]|uniref:Uncharacterized protein n=1 Tax=Bizionia argentinensis JUB59 TaxID=1046627 RepID=G2ED75_9FLAO|nr:hypothetical protein [Bizionia argentinensis]EGV43598.1 hypothetical protein BZARG_2618 [Bizionia argentinensis JUB59]